MQNIKISNEIKNIYIDQITITLVSFLCFWVFFPLELSIVFSISLVSLFYLLKPFCQISFNPLIIDIKLQKDVSSIAYSQFQKAYLDENKTLFFIEGSDKIIEQTSLKYLSNSKTNTVLQELANRDKEISIAKEIADKYSIQQKDNTSTNQRKRRVITKQEKTSSSTKGRKLDL